VCISNDISRVNDSICFFFLGFWPLLFFNSFLAYFVNLTNFLVTKHTSALTLQVIGNAKGVVAVIASVICFRNPVTLYTALGYSITVGGVILYSHAKRNAKKSEALRKISTKMSDIERPRSPFGSDKDKSLDQFSSEQLLPKPVESGDNGSLGIRSLSSAISDKIMARGFSSIFEA